MSELSTAKTYKLISTDEKSVVNKHCSDIGTKLAVESQENFPHFIGYQNFINDLTKLVSSQTLAYIQLRVCLTAFKNHWIKYCEKTYEREGIIYFWSIKNSIEILNKLKKKVFKLQLFLHTIFLRFILHVRYHII